MEIVDIAQVRDNLWQASIRMDDDNVFLFFDVEPTKDEALNLAKELILKARYPELGFTLEAENGKTL